MDSLPLIVLAIVLVMAVVMLAGMAARQRSRSGLDYAYYQKQWAIVLSHKTHGRPGYQLAIFEADKLFDHALKSKGFAGQTMGERLKNAKSTLRNNDAVWFAHKLRNRLAHEQDVPLDGIATEKALRAFKAGLKDLGAM